jgi:hypothetical protein
MTIDFQTLQDLSHGQPVADAPCPLCSSGCSTPSNRMRKVLRIYNKGDGFATFTCARCNESGWAHPEGAVRSEPRPARIEPAAPAPDKSETARFIWSKRKPIAGSIAETYLRQARGYQGPLPATLGFLPARSEHAPAMVAVFGIPAEPEPGNLVVDDEAVTGIHLTRLKPDGSGKAEEPAKIMIGPSKGLPIVLAPVNDLGGLLIGEGIENVLACHASGLGLWAGASAGRLPALTDKVPAYVEAVSIIADTDDSGAGIKFSEQLGQALLKRGIDVLLEAGGRRG